MRTACRAALIGALVLAFGPGRASAQDPRIEQPRTPAEFWSALEFELNTGQFDAAAAYLRGFLNAKPTEKDFVAIERDRGMAAFLRLRTVRRWSADPKAEAEARQNAEQVVELATAAVKKELSDPQRITRFIQNLSATPEERAYAISELQRSGAPAVP